MTSVRQDLIDALRQYEEEERKRRKDKTSRSK